MMVTLIMLILLLILLLATFGGSGSTRVKPRKFCDKDPTKECPHTLIIHKNGALEADVTGLLTCCLAQDQIAATRRLYQRARAQGKDVEAVKWRNNDE